MINAVRVFVNMLLSVLYRYEVVNKENFPKEGSALMCSNHKGEIDMLFIGARVKRLVHYMAKEELFKVPVLGGFLKWVGTFPVKRGKGDIEAIKKALSLLKEGKIVGIYPEGTRVRDNRNKVSKPKAGAALLAVKSGAPIFPVLVEGSYRPFSKVRVIFGKPYYLEIDKDKKYTNEELTEFSVNIMERVYGLAEGK